MSIIPLDTTTILPSNKDACLGPDFIGDTDIRNFNNRWTVWDSGQGVRYVKSEVYLPDTTTGDRSDLFANDEVGLNGLTVSMNRYGEMIIGYQKTPTTFELRYKDNNGDVVAYEFTGYTGFLYFNGLNRYNQKETEVVCYYIKPGTPRTIFARFESENFETERTIHTGLNYTVSGLLKISKADGNFNYLIAQDIKGKKHFVTYSVAYPIIDPYTNEPPVVDAGDSESRNLFTFPQTFTTNATADDPDFQPKVTEYLWELISSEPSTNLGRLSTTAPVIDNPTDLNTDITVSGFGKYTFRLTVTDGEDSVSDAVVYEVDYVNIPPTVDAGDDESYEVPDLPFVMDLDGFAEDPDGFEFPLVTTWTQVSGPASVISNTASQITTASASLPGTYVYRLTATDGIATVNDTVTKTITYTNKIPVVNAGPDQTSTTSFTLPKTFLLGGTASDPDNYPNPLTTLWTKVSGPSGATISSPTTLNTSITITQLGTYVYRLTATDGDATVFDEVTLTYTYTNIPPSVTLPANFNYTMLTLLDVISINGITFDPDNYPSTPLVVTWSQLSGPTATRLTAIGADSSQWRLNGPGVYVFQLSAFDGEATTTKQITVTANYTNKVPVVDAGLNQSIVSKDPVLVNLSGTASDPDNYPGPLTVLWTQLSGPAVTINNPTTLTPNFTATSLGTYVFRLTATDTVASVSDTVTITKSYTNLIPTVDAGDNEDFDVCIYPHTGSLSGTASDPDNYPNPLSTLWTQISGPTATIDDPTALLTSVDYPEAGVYVFRLTANDGMASVYSEVTKIYECLCEVVAETIEEVQEYEDYPLTLDVDSLTYVEDTNSSTFVGPNGSTGDFSKYRLKILEEEYNTSEDISLLANNVSVFVGPPALGDSSEQQFSYKWMAWNLNAKTYLKRVDLPSSIDMGAFSAPIFNRDYEKISFAFDITSSPVAGYQKDDTTIGIWRQVEGEITFSGTNPLMFSNSFYWSDPAVQTDVMVYYTKPGIDGLFFRVQRDNFATEYTMFTDQPVKRIQVAVFQSKHQYLVIKDDTCTSKVYKSAEYPTPFIVPVIYVVNLSDALTFSAEMITGEIRKFVTNYGLITETNTLNFNSEMLAGLISTTILDIGLQLDSATFDAEMTEGLISTTVLSTDIEEDPANYTSTIEQAQYIFRVVGTSTNDDAAEYSSTINNATYTRTDFDNNRFDYDLDFDFED